MSVSRTIAPLGMTRGALIQQPLTPSRTRSVAATRLAFALGVSGLLLLSGCGGGGGGGRGVAPPPPLAITTTSLADGITGQGYSRTVQATGGSGSKTWSLASGNLPTGLNLTPGTGEISGTPSAVGTFNFTVRVQDSGSPQQSDSQALTIRIAAPLAISTTSLPNGADDTAYNATVTASGGLAPLTWSISAGNPPAGFTINSSTGAITGTPTTGGSFTFTVQVRDSLNPQQTATRQFTILILEITTTGLPDGVQNQSYGPVSLSVTGNAGTLTWSQTGLPANLTLNPSTGAISGTPTGFGTFNVTVTVNDSNGARSDSQVLSLFIAQQLLITTPSLPAGTTGAAYSQTLTAIGGLPPYTWSEPTAFFDNTTGQGAAATPCQGLTLNFSAGTITGTPANIGTCGPFTIRVDDSGAPAQFDEAAFSITVNPGPLLIVTTSLPPGAVNRSYSETLQATGGTPPFAWSEPTGLIGVAATPCQGLSLDAATGTISGTPVNQGTCGPFTIRVDDFGGQFDTQDLSITINPEPVGRNDTVATATALSGSNINIEASISPFSDPSATAPDQDFYRLTATVPADVVVEIHAQDRTPRSFLDSVIEIVSDDSSPTGVRFGTGCRDPGDDSPSNPDIAELIVIDTTPSAFDDACINDDIDLGLIRDSKLTFRVPGNSGDVVTFFVRVLDWRGDARPDFVYELRITGAN